MGVKGLLVSIHKSFYPIVQRPDEKLGSDDDRAQLWLSDYWKWNSPHPSPDN